MKKSKKKSEISNISVLTLGCCKNLVDSEQLLGILRSNGYKLVEDMGQADAVIINTCGFINDAKQESINLIFSIGEMKKHDGIQKLIVVGCLSQRYHEALASQIPDVDHFFGINEHDKVLKALKGEEKFTVSGSRYLLTPSHYAYLKISEGCSHRCAFCAIPLIRGPYVSRPMESILAEAGTIAAMGVKELIVIAQDTTFYGMDLYKERKIAELLDRLAQMDKFDWIRLMYTYPADFPEDVLDVMARNESICKYIDLPLQHISDNMLKSMKRHSTGSQLRKLVETIREKVPGAAIRSTFITGFPGETDADYQELYNFISEYKLDRVGVFTYSHEDGTPAFAMKNDVPEEIKLLWKEAIMIKQAEISLAKNRQLIGSRLRVLADGFDDEGRIIARSEKDAPEIDNAVIIAGDSGVEPGQFANVTIRDASEYDLNGEL